MLTSSLVDPFDRPFLPVHVHALPTAHVVAGVAQTLGDGARQVHLLLHSGVHAWHVER